MMSIQKNRDPRVDSFDRTKPFVAIKGNKTVGFIQNRCAFDHRARLLPEVKVAVTVGKDPDGVKFRVGGVPYLGDGVEFKRGTGRPQPKAPTLVQSNPEPEGLAEKAPPVSAGDPLSEQDGDAVREADLAPPPARKGKGRSKRRS